MGALDAEHQAEVELAPIERVEQGEVAIDPDLEPHLGARVREPRQHRRQPGLGEVGRQPQPDGLGELGAADRRHRFVVERQQAARVAEHLLTGRGDREAAAGFRKQRLAGLLFEPAHLQADRGLRPADPPGGAREAAEIDREHQRSQHIEVEADRGRWLSFTQAHIMKYQFF